VSNAAPTNLARRGLDGRKDRREYGQNLSTTHVVVVERFTKGTELMGAAEVQLQIDLIW